MRMRMMSNPGINGAGSGPRPARPIILLAAVSGVLAAVFLLTSCAQFPPSPTVDTPALLPANVYTPIMPETASAGAMTARTLLSGDMAFEVEKLAKGAACFPYASAMLTERSPGIQKYRLSCVNGQPAFFVCELRQCRMTRSD